MPREEQQRRAGFNTGDALRDVGVCAKTYRKRRGRHEHRRVAEETVGRALTRREIVHHKNGNIRDNAPSNLEIMTQAEHARLHMQERLSAKRPRVLEQ